MFENRHTTAKSLGLISRTNCNNLLISVYNKPYAQLPQADMPSEIKLLCFNTMNHRFFTLNIRGLNITHEKLSVFFKYRRKKQIYKHFFCLRNMTTISNSHTVSGSSKYGKEAVRPAKTH